MHKKSNVIIIVLMMSTFLSLMYLKECRLKAKACELYNSSQRQTNFSCEEMGYSELLMAIGSPENGAIKRLDHILSIFIVSLTFLVVLLASYIRDKLKTSGL